MPLPEGVALGSDKGRFPEGEQRMHWGRGFRERQ